MKDRDRLKEIRARLDGLSWVSDEFIANAPVDIAWLLRRLDFQTRLVSDLEAQLDRAHERHAVEVERLQNIAENARKFAPLDPCDCWRCQEADDA